MQEVIVRSNSKTGSVRKDLLINNKIASYPALPLPISLKYEILDVKKGGRCVRYGVVDSQFAYHKLVREYGDRKNWDIYLMLVDNADGKIIDGMIVHNPDCSDLPGYGLAAHDFRYRKQQRAETGRDHLKVVVFFDMKLVGGTGVERIALDSSDTYYTALGRRDRDRGRWDTFQMIMVDQSSGGKVIDKIDMR
ncbi:MAG: hypothetical protein ACLQF0_14615 [Dissulfurispiraceae bacterium]